MTIARAAARGALGVARRPDLWPTAFRLWTALCPSSWWTRWPPLPVPSRSYLLFRLEAQYGTEAARLEPAELVGYLEWCRRMQALLR